MFFVHCAVADNASHLIINIGPSLLLQFMKEPPNMWFTLPMIFIHGTIADSASRPTISQFCKLAMWKWHISERVFLVLEVGHSSFVVLAAHMLRHPVHAFRVFPAQFAVECTI